MDLVGRAHEIEQNSYRGQAQSRLPHTPLRHGVPDHLRSAGSAAAALPPRPPGLRKLQYRLLARPQQTKAV